MLVPLSHALATAALASLLALTGAVSGSAAPGDRTDLEKHEPERLLVVIDKDDPIDPLDYEPEDLTAFRGGDYEVRTEVAEQLEDLVTAAEDEGLGLRVISGYRSFDTQAGTYDYWVRHYGRAAADATSARPGHSEHQTGLAVDLDNLTGTCYLDKCFGDTDEGEWVAAHAHEFGFVLSYPEGARELTGYAYEPWHIRYVGPQVAGDMHGRGIPLLSAYLGAPASSARIGELLGSRG